MKIAIFGGTGRTGVHLVRQALAQGYALNLLVRSPSKIAIQDEALTLVQGDVKDPQAVEQAIQGTEAVLSVLGPSSNAPTFEVSQGTANILAAMQKHNVPRLIITTGAGVADPHDRPGLFNHVMNFMLKRMAKNVLADMTQTVDLVRRSDRQWTVVRLPMLSDGPPTGSLRVGYVGQGVGARISRADIPAFLLAQVEGRDYIGQSPVISN